MLLLKAFRTTCLSIHLLVLLSGLVPVLTTQRNFAVDTRSFLEALKGESIEDAMGSNEDDAGYEESYGGYSALRDSDPRDNASPPREGNSYRSSLSSRDRSDAPLPPPSPIRSFRSSFGSRNKNNHQNNDNPFNTNQDASYTNSGRSESTTYFPVLPASPASHSESAYESATESTASLRNFLTSSSPKSVEENRISYRTSSKQGSSGGKTYSGGSSSFWPTTSSSDSYSRGGSSYGSNSKTSPRRRTFNPRVTTTTPSYGGSKGFTTSFSVNHAAGKTVTSKPSYGSAANPARFGDDTGIYERAGVDRTTTVTPILDDYDYNSGGRGGSSYGASKGGSSYAGSSYGGQNTNSYQSSGQTGDYDYNDGDALAGLSAYGIPGQDFPIFSSVPNTGFSCSGRLPGYYADPRSRCQAFYICQEDGRMPGFLCPNTTLFNQQLLTCDYWFNVDCSQSESFYSVNENIYAEPQRINRGSYDDSSYSGGRTGSGYNSREGEDYGSTPGYKTQSIPASPALTARSKTSNFFTRRTSPGSGVKGYNNNIKGGVKSSTPVYSATSNSPLRDVTYSVEPEDDSEENAKKKK